MEGHVIVTVLWGPLAGRKALVPKGGKVTLGRSELADLVIPHDNGMATRHLEVAHDGDQCRFRDLDTPTGTFLNGEEGHREGALKHGDFLRAGDTIFTIHFEGHTKAKAAPLDDVERDRLARAERAFSELQSIAAREPLYAVLDMARDKRILTLCRESIEEHVSLYDGIEGENMAQVAPHLVRLHAGSRLLAALVREGFQKRWGIFLTSPAPRREVRRHLRRFLMIEIEDRPHRVYFRFYDPATITSLLPTFTPRQREDFLGEATAIYAETRGGELRRYPHPKSELPAAEGRV